jgi:RNase P/RNase MRP subunit POP5
MIKKNFRSNNALAYPKRVRLMQFDGKHGIIRCAHHDQDKVITDMNTLAVKQGGKPGFITRGCSGTIHALRQRYKLNKEGKCEVV